MFCHQATFVSTGTFSLQSRTRNNLCNYRHINTGSQTGIRPKRTRTISCGAQNAHESHGKTVVDAKDGEKLLHVVFVRPQIHWNTGNIGRTCLGLGAALHLVGPLGFSLDERQIRRAGLDYWQHVDLHAYGDWPEFANGKMKDLGGTRLFFTKFGDQCATEIRWPAEGKIVMIFGSEVDGFDGIRDWLDTAGKNERRVAFPMVDERFRSFNLSTTASMALWDAYKDVTMRGNAGPGCDDIHVDNSVLLGNVR